MHSGMFCRFLLTTAVLGVTGGFSLTPLVAPPQAVSPTLSSAGYHSALFESPRDETKDDVSRPLWRKALDRTDTLKSAGIEDAKLAGVWGRIKKLHGPKTYIPLFLFLGFKLQWPLRSPYYWFVIAFCIKWYRARYVFKIPVWDRQPNWNNIITSKEQEKDLKALTCKSCGSTLFIAKTREFFFEGDTGIGGLGCFACGAKGKDNFVMDRDRIVEDVADIDDYFEYERPLDFVSRAERRKIMKEAGGDEDKANQLLMERSATETAGGDAATEVPSTEVLPNSKDAVNGDISNGDESAEKDETVGVVESDKDGAPKPPTTMETEGETEEAKPKKTKKKKKKKKVAKEVEPAPESTLDDLDFLGMDDF